MGDVEVSTKLLPLVPPPPVVTSVKLTNFSITTTTGNVFVEWGDGKSQFIDSNTPTNHDFYCSDYSLLGGFWNNINSCV